MRAIISGIVAGTLLGGALVGRTAHAQPAPAPSAPPDLERARTLYASAERAAAEGRYDDAIRDYGYAYAITKDPVLFYKIGSAHEKAGRCDAALTYYRRYLDEGAPGPEFVATTRARIVACGGTPDAPPAPDAAPPPPPPTPVDAAPPAETTPVGPLGDATAAGAPAEPTLAPPASLRGHHQGPWLLVGGSLALVTIGAVLAYSAEATENDLADLYVGLEGQPPVFNDQTRARYDDIIDEGERYELLARVSFGLAGALAIGAGVWFWLDRDAKPERVRVTPHASPSGGGVTTTISF